MGKIRVLPEKLSNMIAAGEVIERPASVVKELVENSIDAGASKISVRSDRGGSKLISVSDDGSGMDSDDAMMCLEAHATSKILDENDIRNICTLGFRGEALPSIASVSRLTLRTRQKESIQGFELIVEGGKFIKSAPMGCAPGTEIIVRDIFFNIPARKKFMRSRTTEEKHIIDAFQLLALPNPSVSFELFMDGRNAFSTPAHSGLMPRITTFFGKETADGLIALEYEKNGIKISGFASKFENSRNSRKEQRTFVNGRAVESFAVYRGIKEAYGNMVEKGRFPPVIIFIELSPGMVDVNVHPAKREIRFRDERLVSEAVTAAVRESIRKGFVFPSYSFDYDKKAEAELKSEVESRLSSAPADTTDASEISKLSINSIMEGARIDYSLRQTAVFSKGIPESSQQSPVVGNTENTHAELAFKEISGSGDKAEGSQSETKISGDTGMRILGFLGATYIIAENPSGLVIIDQHAAHERVLFEKILKGSEEKGSVSQSLLFPITLELSRAESLLMEKHIAHFKEAGFEIENLGHDTVMINAIPAPLNQDNAGGLVRDMLAEMLESGGKSGQSDLESVASAACAAAVKAKDKMSIVEAESLIRQMNRCEMPFSCPHGRPTIVNLSLRELEKRFGRK